MPGLSQKRRFLFSLSEVAVPVSVIEIELWSPQSENIELENVGFRVRHHKFMFQGAHGLELRSYNTKLFFSDLRRHFLNTPRKTNLSR